MSIIEKAVVWALGIAADTSHGYDQTNRWGPDYDCSSFVISAYKAAGLPLTATYTGNMKYDFLRHGFVQVLDGSLKRGDVLLHERNHTALYIGGNQLVHASINEKGTIKGGQAGDQTGGEICIRGYYNYPWDCVLRYVEEKTDYHSGSAGHLPKESSGELALQQGEEKEEGGRESAAAAELPVLQEGDSGGAVLSMQTLLIHKWAISCGPDGADGDFGPNTKMALIKLQTGRGIGIDGVCGPESWGAIIGGKNGTY